MKLLLDTHIFIWLATEQQKLNDRERRVLRDPSAAIFLSAVSLWEIRIKWDSRDRHGTRKGKLDPLAALQLAKANSIELVALTPETAISALRVTVEHADPFDRLLLTQAQELDTRLLTRDSKLRNHPLALVP